MIFLKFKCSYLFFMLKILKASVPGIMYEDRPFLPFYLFFCYMYPKTTLHARLPNDDDVGSWIHLLYPFHAVTVLLRRVACPLLVCFRFSSSFTLSSFALVPESSSFCSIHFLKSLIFTLNIYKYLRTWHIDILFWNLTHCG